MADKPAAPFDDAVLLAVVLSAHGLKGEVKLKLFSEKPDALQAYGAVTSGDGRQFEVSSLRAFKGDEAVARLKGFDDRDAPPEEDEFYHADLVGLSAADEKGKALGTVLAIHNFGAGDMIEIGVESGDSQFFSFTREVVPLIDLDGKRIVISAEANEG
ncbi:MAG: PRC-barrel domain-containing protein [Alphaproteobacteria bacterium]